MKPKPNLLGGGDEAALDVGAKYKKAEMSKIIMTAREEASWVLPLGVLMKEARLAARKTGKECAEAMGCPPAVYTAYEQGQKSPSLPEIELLAYFLDLPPAHFCFSEIISKRS
jgi:hypothetical protein